MTRNWIGQSVYSPIEYALEFKNPNDQKLVRWDGGYGLAPLIVEVLDGDVYLVVHPEYCNVDLTQYGNPNPPYIRLKYVSGQWVQVSEADYPDSLRKLNLLHTYTDFPVEEWTLLTVESIRRFNRPHPQDSGFIQDPIPKDFDSWKYKYKQPGAHKRC
jgi:hypothetical protein